MQRNQKRTRRARYKQWRQGPTNILSAHLFFGAMLISLWRLTFGSPLNFLPIFWRHQFSQKFNGG